jgi:hypothetical protein
MIRGSTVNLEDILICPSQKDYKLVPYSDEQINTMTLNIMMQLGRTKNERNQSTTDFLGLHALPFPQRVVSPVRTSNSFQESHVCQFLNVDLYACVSKLLCSSYWLKLIDVG